ncbi:MAG: glutamine--scyllo-inositol aminotransferase [Frankiales bacterium]|nr:glutamine--scyllo-inositol aminotransferase [Frankiales bacterium]
MTTIPVMRPWLGDEEAEAAAQAVRSGWIAQGARVRAFEQAFAERVGAAEAVAVSSCTAALHLSLLLSGVGPGDEVVVPSLSFIATANVVRHTGAEPVFADVDPETGNLTAKTVETVLGPRTRAVLAVHQAGVPTDVEELRRLCDPLAVPVLEDAACAVGSVLRGRAVGAGALMAAWSFHPRKLLTTGEGGMLTTDDAAWAARARRLREHGMDVSAADRHDSRSLVLERYLEVGFNYRMTDVQAAIGLVQLAKLDAMVSRRRVLAARYRDLLREVPGLHMVDDPPHGRTNYQSFWVVLPDDFPAARDDVLRAMLEAGISCRRGIMAAHLEPPYAGRVAELPVTERLTAQSLVLPVFHTMTEDEQGRVAAVVLALAR